MRRMRSASPFHSWPHEFLGLPPLFLAAFAFAPVFATSPGAAFMFSVLSIQSF